MNLATPYQLMPNELITAVQKGECILFVGAGLSRGANLPDWKSLLKSMNNYCLNNLPDYEIFQEINELINENKLKIVAQAMRQRLGEMSFNNFLKGELDFESIRIAEAHRLIPQIPFKCILTTNYDNLIERGFIDNGEKASVITHANISEYSNILNIGHVFKIHGSIDDISTVILGKKDYDELIYLNQPYVTCLNSIFFQKSVLFIGSSLDDTDPFDILTRLKTIFRGNTRNHYALIKAGHFTSIEKKYYKDTYNISIIEYRDHPDIHVFLRDLADKVKLVLRLSKKSTPNKLRIEPLPFNFLIAPLTRVYIGREWLHDELKEVFRTRKSNVFFILGDPGMGKSAFFAYLTTNDSGVIAYHFCSSTFSDSLNPRLFIQSLAAQLSNNLPEYKSELDLIRLDEIDSGKTDVLFINLIAEPLNRIKEPDGCKMILVDSLDEAFTFGEDNIATLLRDQISYFPPWLNLVLNSRDMPDIKTMFSQCRLHNINSEIGNNRRDIRTYVEFCLKEQSLRSILDKCGISHEAFIKMIEEKADGNFLYADRVIKGIISDQLDPLNPRDFPRSLSGAYQLYFERTFPVGRDYPPYKDILSVLMAAREPLSAKQIANFIGKDAKYVDYHMSKISAFFHRDDTDLTLKSEERVYRAFHKSIQDWLSGNDLRDNPYCLDVQSGHRIIAKWLYDSYCHGDTSRFVISHLAFHLAEANRSNDLEKILTDLEFIGEKFRIGQAYELLEDYRRIGLGQGSPIVTASCYYNNRIVIVCPFCGKRNDLQIDCLGLSIKCGACWQSLKLNPFYIDKNSDGNYSLGRR